MNTQRWLDLSQRLMGHSNLMFGGFGIGDYGPITPNEYRRLRDKMDRENSDKLRYEFEARIANRSKDQIMFVIDRITDPLYQEFKKWRESNNEI